MKLKIDNISFAYKNSENRKVVFSDICFSIDSKETTIIMGRSGVGKTTLVRLISGLIKPDKGNIFINNSIIEEPSSDIVVSFQENTYFPWLTVIDNVLFGIKKTNENIVLARQLLKSVGLSEYEKEFPNILSGGMKQRLGIIRSIVVQPKFIILDEPFSALDVVVKSQLIDFIIKKKEEYGFGILCILHSIEDAFALGDRIIVIDNTTRRISMDIKLSDKTDFLSIRKEIINNLENT